MEQDSDSEDRLEILDLTESNASASTVLEVLNAHRSMRIKWSQAAEPLDTEMESVDKTEKNATSTAPEDSCSSLETPVTHRR